MKPSIFLRGLLLLLMLVPITGCLNDSGSESGTDVEFVEFDPDNFSCNPLDGGQDFVGLNLGVHASLYYLKEDQPAYTDVNDYIQYGHHISNLDLFFNQIYLPTRPFDRGFVTENGQTIKTEQGDTLYEYFALKLRGKIVKGSLPQGLYQFALLTDDGAVLNMNFGSGDELVVDNNGQHPTRMGCAAAAVELSDDPIPFEMLYNQGPRHHIAMTLLVRPWTAGMDPNDPECGKSGNDRYFDSTQNPPEPQQAYLDLQSRGWMPLAPNNYLLPDDKIENPCAGEVPIITDVIVENITSNSVTLTWTTDIHATSEVDYKAQSDVEFVRVVENSNGMKSHRVTVAGLNPNTDYVFKAVSRSRTGQSSESSEIVARTRR